MRAYFVTIKNDQIDKVAALLRQSLIVYVFGFAKAIQTF